MYHFARAVKGTKSYKLTVEAHIGDWPLDILAVPARGPPGNSVQAYEYDIKHRGRVTQQIVPFRGHVHHAISCTRGNIVLKRPPPGHRGVLSLANLLFHAYGYKLTVLSNKMIVSDKICIEEKGGT